MNDLKKKYHTFKGVELPAMMRYVPTGTEVLIIAVDDDGDPRSPSGGGFDQRNIEPLPDIYEEFAKAVKGKKIKWTNPSYETTFLKWAGDVMPNGKRLFRDTSGDARWTFVKNKGPLGGWTIVEDEPKMIELCMGDIKPGDELMDPDGEVYHGFSYTNAGIYINLFHRSWLELQEMGWKIRSIGEDWRKCEKEAGR